MTTRLMMAMVLVSTGFTWAAEPTSRPVIEPGKVWFDTDGREIQAHSAGILLKDGVYYWYGEEKTHGNLNKVGVACYSSRDLYRWKSEGIALAKSELPKQFQDRGICERAKVLYCAKTGKYVMWMHLDDQQYVTAMAGVAVAERPEGPFEHVAHFRPVNHDFGAAANDRCRQKELGGTYRDMNLFLDDDGRAYVFYASEDNRTMYVVRLNEEFTGPERPAVLGKTWNRILVGHTREAPAPFKHMGTYYLITSACTGWGANAASYATASDVLGPYKVMGNPCVGADRNKTFGAQGTFVLPVGGKSGCFIFMADRWNADRLGDSRYIWLPFVVKEDGTFTIEYREGWDMSIFDQLKQQATGRRGRGRGRFAAWRRWCRR